MRPTTLKKDNTQYWVIELFDPADGITPVDADSAPTVAIRKNGSITADSVTVNKRSATTGIYDCSYNPAAEVEGDNFTVEESAVIASTTYPFKWSFVITEAERGTDGANTTTPPDAAANATATRSELAVELARIDENISAAKTLTAAYDAAQTAAQAGDAMTLTSSERSTLAGVIDLALINQGDGADLLTALADHIADDWIAGDNSALAVASAVWKQLTSTLTDAGSIGKLIVDMLDAAITSRASASSISDGSIVVGTVNDKAGYALTQAFPDNFADLSITVGDGEVTAENMRGTDGANTVVPDAAGTCAAIVLGTTFRTYRIADVGSALNSISASALARFLTVDTGQTAAVAGSVGKIAQGSAGSGDASEANQLTMLAKLTKPLKIWNNPQRANHIEIIRGDAYDGDGTPGSSHLKFSWDFGKDITGKAFTMTIRGKDDAKTDDPLMTVSGTGVGQLAVPSIPSSKTIDLPITSDDTQLIFDVEVTHDTDSKQSQVGTVTVIKDAT